jgi:hypothetical protein
VRVPAGAPMNCPSCGEPVRPHAAFCGACGTKLAVPSAPVAPVVPGVPGLPAVASVPPPPPPPREITVPPGLSPISTPSAPPPPPAPPSPPPAAPPARVEVPAPTPGEPADDEHPLADDRTVLAARKPHVSATPQSGGTWLLITPDGTREPITGVVVVGRQPAKTAFKGSDRSLILKDPDGQVSKSHAVFEVDDAGLWVRDLGSTNGVVVIAPTGEEAEATGGDRVAVPAGAEVELGGYVLTVERA